MPNEFKQTKSEDETEDNPIKENGLLYALILLIIFLGADFLFKLNLKKKTKQDLADYYGVTRKTLTKWIIHFTSIDITTFNKKRKIDFSEWQLLLNELGSINEDSKPLKKKELMQLCDTSYRVLRENNGLTSDTYKNINIFPPKISKEILIHNGVL